jgi:PhoPQ-activated pathogenicity-related protein
MSPSNEMLAYVQKPDAGYAWEKRYESKNNLGTVVDLHLVSQVWQGIRWEHRLQVFVPVDAGFPETALLLVTADGGGRDDVDMGQLYAEATGMVCAFLYHVPNQPLFGDKMEDALIAHTFVQYLDTGDPDWPLLFPMVKSAVRAMDAVQACCRQERGQAPQRFVVTGASKRGWTAWLTAVADARVAAIVPLVYDNLNLFAQMPHQVEVWEGYSDQISDYTEAGLMEKMFTERGQHLAQLVDPYTYREQLTLPKLIVNGANDRYWATDALNLYWNDLKGPKYVLYVPNTGHGLADAARVFNTCSHFERAIASGHPLPELHWEFREDDGAVYLAIHSDTPAREAHLWVAHAPTRDFRSSVWSGVPMHGHDGHQGFAGHVEKTAHGAMAVFGEIAFTHKDAIYTLSTQMHLAKKEADF